MDKLWNIQTTENYSGLKRSEVSRDRKICKKVGHWRQIPVIPALNYMSMYSHRL
jgi:hypothetical protein